MKTLNEEEMVKMYKDNKPITEIAEFFGVCTVSITRRIKKLGIKREILTKFEDISGQRFGRLVAIRPVRKDRFGKYIWKVRCDCGKEKDINSSGIKAGIVVSCGCYRMEKNFKGCGDLSQSYWHKVEKAAHQRGYEFTITLKEAWDIFIQQDKKCALSGVPLLMFTNNDKYYLQTASLDRIDSTKGYVSGNIQWVHKRVNFLKRDYDEKELLFWCNEISKSSSWKLGDFVFSSVERERRPLNENTQVVEA